MRSEQADIAAEPHRDFIAELEDRDLSTFGLIDGMTVTEINRLLKKTKKRTDLRKRST